MRLLLLSTLALFVALCSAQANNSSSAAQSSAAGSSSGSASASGSSAASSAGNASITAAPTATVFPASTLVSQVVTVSGNSTVTLNSTSIIPASTSVFPRNLTTVGTPAGLASITAFAPGVSASGIAVGPDDSYIAGAGRLVLAPLLLGVAGGLAVLA
ncbi:hypothetical protein JCM10450v2_000320 [Rhodotorula kratochvilovae]